MTSRDAISIHVCGGPAAGYSLTLPLGSWTVGRSPIASVSLDDPGMTAYHASLMLRPDRFDAIPVMGDVRVVSRDRDSLVCVLANSTLRIQRDSSRPMTSAATLETRRAVQPPQWSTMVAGAVMSVALSVVMGQPLVAMFGLTAFAVAVITWLSVSALHRRAGERTHGRTVT